MAASQHFTSIFPLRIGSFTYAGYSAFFAFLANILVAVVLTLVLNAVRVSAGADETRPGDYLREHDPLDAGPRAVAPAAVNPLAIREPAR
jgi:SSS family solute:Na+ symporter